MKYNYMYIQFGFQTHRLYLEVSYDKVCLLDGVDECNVDVGVLLGARVGPVLRALDLHLLHEVSEHYHRWDVVVPDQSPEVAHSVRERALGSYVLPLSIETLCKCDARNNVMGALHSQSTKLCRFS